MYKLTGSIIVGDASTVTKKENAARLWHMYLGYISERYLQALHKRSVVTDIKYYKLDLCKFCIMGKQHRVAFSTSQYKIKGLLDLTHMNVWGPSPIASIGDARYYVTFIDDFQEKFGYTS